MSFKDISYLELWWPFCSAEQSHLCYFGRGNPEEQNYFEFGPVVWEMLSKRFLIWSSGIRRVQWSRTINAIFLKDIMRNNSVKLFLIWGSSSGDVV